MRLQGLNIYSQYFRFLLEDDKAIADNTASPFGPMVTAVIYDNERQTIHCACTSNGAPCDHKVFIHEMIDKEEDRALFRFLEDCREKSAQTITRETVSRLRGAFAREYNFAKGVVQPPEPFKPLGWQGSIPGSSNRMRVVQVPQRSLETFAVFENGDDIWRTVVGIDNPTCNGGVCRRGCRHEKAVELAVRTWREQGLLPKPKILGKSADTVIMDDLTMVEKAEPVSRTGTITGGFLAIPTGDDGNWYVEKELQQMMREAFRRPIFDAILNTSTANSANITFDSAKFEEDAKKVMKLLEEREKPKKEKPAKPRTRFTDLEL